MVLLPISYVAVKNAYYYYYYYEVLKMSYGVWKKRGDGWATLEIDTPSNRDFWDMERNNPAKLNRLRKDCENVGIYFDTYYCDPNQLRWECTQKKKGLTVIDWNIGGGEHHTWIAYDGSRYALLQALMKGTHADKEERARIVKSQADSLERREAVPDRFTSDPVERIIRTEQALTKLHEQLEHLIKQCGIFEEWDSSKQTSGKKLAYEEIRSVMQNVGLHDIKKVITT